MATLEKAIELASFHHAGQRDKAGEPYILHPLRLMFFTNNPDEQIVAVLHDIIEDTFISDRQLGLYGFKKEIVDAVVAISRRGNESYEDFIIRLSTNQLARRVKLLDLKDNMDLSRLGGITPKDIERWQKYKKAFDFLTTIEEG